MNDPIHTTRALVQAPGSAADRSLVKHRARTRAAGLLLAAGLVLWPTARNARAGEWALDHYVWTGKAHSEGMYWSKGGGNQLSAALNPPLEVNVRNQSSAGEELLWDYTMPIGASIIWHTRPLGSVAPPAAYSTPPTLNAAADSSVSAQFKWQRTKLPDEHGEHTVDDPQDNPPKWLFVREQAGFFAQEEVGNYDGWSIAPTYNAQTPWAADYYEMEAHFHGSDRWQGALGQGVPSWGQEAQWSYPSGQSRIIKIAVTGDLVNTPTLSFNGRVQLKPGYQKDEGRYSKAFFYFTYQADLARFEIGLKRRSSNLPLSSGPYNQASITAGGEDTSDKHHWAEVYVTTVPPLAGQRIPMKPEIKGGTVGSQKQTEWRPDPNPVTDENGRARIGWLLSNDSTTRQPFELHVQRHPEQWPEPVARFRQAWDEESSSEEGENPSHWAWDPRVQNGFEYGESIPVTFFPSFQDTYNYGPYDTRPPLHETVKVTRHAINFLVGRMQVTGIDAHNGENSGAQTWIFTSNPREANPNASPPVLYVDQAVLDTYAGCNPRQVGDDAETGRYPTSLVINEPPHNAAGEEQLTFGTLVIKEAKIDQAWLKAQDDEVYEPLP